LVFVLKAPSSIPYPSLKRANEKSPRDSARTHFLCALCTAILQFARGLRGFLTQQKHKADRIMAGQNYGESNTGAPLLNDSLISGCGYAALCSLRLIHDA
jgi:hypothetical protein